jgi:cell division protein FtsL
MRQRLNPLLALGLVLCALMLVNSQHQVRQLFIELERAQEKTRQLEIEAKELELKQSTLGQHARIEASAKRDLNMILLTPANTMYLTAETK